MVNIYNITALRFVQGAQKILSSFTQQLQRCVEGGEFMNIMDRNQTKHSKFGWFTWKMRE